MTTLGDGYRVEAEITVLELDDIVRAPASPVFRSEEAHAVFLVGDGTVETREVEVGATTGLETQILAGLEPGDVVVTYPTDEVRAGVRVRRR